MSPDQRDSRFAIVLRRGVGASIRNNFTAYGFSIMITATLAVISAERGAPAVGEVFLLVAGAVVAFVLVEAVVSGGFKHGVRGEPADVLALGTAFNLLSAGLAVGLAALGATAIDAVAAWFVSPFVATLSYVLTSGVELAIAEWIKES